MVLELFNVITTKRNRAKIKSVRKSAGAIPIAPNVRCQRIYPVEDTRKNVSELKTVGIKLSKDQAIHLARVLLAVSQEWDKVDITGWRFDKRHSDRTYHLTITSNRPIEE
jgi:hypothetical protein